MGPKTRSHRRGCLDWKLVAIGEISLRSLISGQYSAKIASLCRQFVHQPSKAAQSDLKCVFIAAPTATQDESMSNLCVGPSQLRFKPEPVLAAIFFKSIQQLLRQRFAKHVRQAVSAEPPKIFVDAKQSQCPSLRGSGVAE